MQNALVEILSAHLPAVWPPSNKLLNLSETSLSSVWANQDRVLLQSCRDVDTGYIMGDFGTLSGT